MANSLTTNKICSASSFVMPYAPSRAVDGANINYDLTSRWVTNTNNTGSYMTVDLGAFYKLTNWSVTCLGITALQWPGGNALYNLQDFDLQIPTDNTLKTWGNVDSVVGNAASSISRNCTAVVTRYVRLNIRANKGNHFANYNPCTSVVSFDVFGIPVTSNANLSNLTASSGALVPTFASATKDYTVNVGYSVTTTTVTPTAQDAGATITVNNVAVVSGQASQAINLNVGSNVITTVVSASDGVTKRTYTVNVIRAAALTGLTISNGTLDPVFAGGTYTYTASVINSVDSITMTPTAPSGCTIKVNGVSVNSGSVSQTIPLNVGSNAIPVVVTSQDGSTSATYTVTVTRSAAAYLSGIVFSEGAGFKTPPFNKIIMNWDVNVLYTTGSFTLTPTAEDANATITINGSTIASGSPWTATSPNPGETNIITIQVAVSGKTTSTYILTVLRATSPFLSNLKVSGYPGVKLNETFSSTKLDYTITRSGTKTSITFTPTTEDTSTNFVVLIENSSGFSQSVASGTGCPVPVNISGGTIVTITVNSRLGADQRKYIISVS